MTIATALAVVASGFVVLVGTNENTGVLDLLNGHTWLRNTRTGTLSLANDASGTVDFNLKIDGAANSNISVTEDGRVAVLVDPKSRTYAAIDLAQYGTRDGQKMADADATDLVLAGNAVYVIDRANGVIEKRDGSALGKLLGRVKVGGDLTRGVIDADGRLWVADERTGKALALASGGGDLKVDETVPVASRGSALELSVVDGRPTVLDFGDNVLATIDGNDVGERVRLPLQVGESMRVPREVRGAPLPIAVNATGRVILVEGRDATSVPLEGRKGTTLGEPAVFAERIYVPDERTGEVIVLDRDGGVVGTPVKVRTTPGPIDLLAGADVLYLQAPDGTTAVQIDEEGNRRQVNKVGPDIPTNDEQPPQQPPPTPPAPEPAPGANAIAASPPGAPVAPNATCGNRMLDLTWGPAPENGAPVTGYVITWTASKGAGGTQTVGNQASARITGLVNGVTYTASITPQSAAGAGAPAQAAPCTTSSAIPDAPDGVKAEAKDDGSIVVSWNYADDGKGNPVPTYVVAPTTAGPSTKTVPATAGTGQQTTTIALADGLVLGASYQFTVKSQLAAPPGATGTGASSVLSTPSNSVKVHSKPKAPTGLTAVRGNKTIRLNWDLCSAADCTGGESIEYFVRMNSGVWEKRTPGTDFIGLATGTDYTFEVVARNMLGDGASATVVASPSGPPKVTSTTVSTDGYRSATWDIAVEGYGMPVTCEVKISYSGGSQTDRRCNGQSQPIGWSTNFSMSATITTDFGTATTSGSSATRAAKPSVTIRWGGSAEGQALEGGGTCGRLCRWIVVEALEFNPGQQLNIYCLTTRRADGSRQSLATWTTRQAGADGNGNWASPAGPSNCFFGYPGQAVQLWVSGYYSSPLEYQYP